MISQQIKICDLNETKLIKGIEIKKFLTEDEIQDLYNLGFINDHCWSGAVLTGSVAYGTNENNSDIDIFLSNGGILSTYIDYVNRSARQLPEGWEHKNVISDPSGDYCETDLNICKGRINLFTLDTEGCDYYKMYCDATRICMAGNGNKLIFKEFCKLMTEYEVYL